MSDFRTAPMIVGCMGLGGSWDRATPYGAAEVAQANALVDAALEHGLNFFDHADIYTRGKAEEVFGRVLADRPGLRDGLIIQTKVGIRFAGEPAGTPQRFDFSRDYLVAAAEAGLRRLGSGHIDILLLHRPDPLMEGEEVAEAFRALRDSGKVRHFGVSNCNRSQMQYLQSFLDQPLVANQLEMNLLHHGFAEAGISFNQAAPGYPDGWEGVLEYCRLNAVQLQAWSPLAKGLLSGAKLDGQPDTVKATAALVADMARERGVPAEAIVLAWLLRHPAGIRPVLGTTKPERLAACAAALKVKLSREEWYRLFESARGASMP